MLDSAFCVQAGFANPDYPEGMPLRKHGNAVVYSRLGALSCEVYYRVCLGNRCKLFPHKECQNQSLFFSTWATGAGDEIGWDFVNRVLGSRVSFSGYCKEMTRFYLTNNTMASPFMSKVTFIRWFFGWLSAFKFDLRKETDPFCCQNPKFLACDGTHIGVSGKYQELVKPVGEPDHPNDRPQPVHKR